MTRAEAEILRAYDAGMVALHAAVRARDIERLRRAMIATGEAGSRANAIHGESSDGFGDAMRARADRDAAFVAACCDLIADAVLSTAPPDDNGLAVQAGLRLSATAAAFRAFDDAQEPPQ